MANSNSLKKKTLLIVEDDPGSRQLMSYLVNKLDMDSLDVDTAEAALDTLKDNNVQAFLLDIALGNGMDGMELGQRIKAEQRFTDTPMIAVTAYDRKALDNFTEIGFTGYLQKPYSREKLKALLAQQMAGTKNKKKLIL